MRDETLNITAEEMDRIMMKARIERSRAAMSFFRSLFGFAAKKDQKDLREPRHADLAHSAHA
jgi:hypothetical protein